MNFYKTPPTTYFLATCLMTTILKSEPVLQHASEKVMSIQGFERAINNYTLLKREQKTARDQPLEKYELKMIAAAINEEGKNYGGEFDIGREINSFAGQTLVVGGGKLKGTYGDNQGKTVLFDLSNEKKENHELIYKLKSGEWQYDPHTGTEFESEESKEDYIKELQRKEELYKKAFDQKNKDILDRYYTLNITRDVQPDMLGSITSESDMSKIPDNKFMRVEFENVPCQVFLNPKLYKILERITKPGGKIELTVTNACRRLIAPVIQNTKFGQEYDKMLEVKYKLLETLHPTYHRLSFELTNY